MLTMAVHSSYKSLASGDEEDDFPMFCACFSDDDEDDPFEDAVESMSDLRRLAASNSLLISLSNSGLKSSNPKIPGICISNHKNKSRSRIKIDVIDENGVKQKHFVTDSSNSPSDTDSGVHDTSTGDVDEEDDIILPTRYSLVITRSIHNIEDADSDSQESCTKTESNPACINNSQGNNIKDTIDAIVEPSTTCPALPVSPPKDTLANRANDLDTALQWLRQEIVSI